MLMWRKGAFRWYHSPVVLVQRQKKSYVNKRARWVPGKPETVQDCEGKAWLQNPVGFFEEPRARLFAEDNFYQSHDNLGTRPRSATVFHVAGKCKGICAAKRWEICTGNRKKAAVWDLCAWVIQAAAGYVTWVTQGKSGMQVSSEEYHSSR